MSNVKISWDSERSDHKLLAALENVKLDIMRMCLADIAAFDYEVPDAEHENTIRYLNKIVPGSVLGSPSNVSIAATAMLLCSFGEFPIPQEILDYIVEEYKEGRVNERKFPSTKELFEKGKTLVEAFMEKGLPYYSACTITGATWVECGWNVHVYNKLEHNNGGVGNTGGWPGCGEGLFGLTFWTQKQKVIKKMMLPGIDQNITKEGYAKNNVHLCDLDENWWIDILKTYLEICVPKHKDILYSEEEPEDDETRTQILCSGYLFKAAGGLDSTFENVKETTEKYMRTHIAQAKNKTSYQVYNGFALQIWISILLDKYLHDEEFDLGKFGIDSTFALDDNDEEQIYRNAAKDAINGTNSTKIESLKLNKSKIKESLLKKKDNMKKNKK